MNSLIVKPRITTAKLLGWYCADRSIELRNQVAERYFPLVRRLCRRFLTSREPQEDLFQIGTMGLISALKKFDPERGAFASLAIPEILGAILNHLRDHGSIMKVPRRIRAQKLLIDKVAAAHAPSLGRWPITEELAELCGLTLKEVVEAQIFAMIGDPRSLDEPMEDENEEGNSSLLDYHGVSDERIDSALDSLVVENLIATLPRRERTILRLRFSRQMSQREIAERIGISQMHVSRQERWALAELRSGVNGDREALLDIA